VSHWPVGAWPPLGTRAGQREVVRVTQLEQTLRRGRGPSVDKAGRVVGSVPKAKGEEI
jgi:hypothetical protein